ncbi:tyrosine-type recombinase/integrase [Paucilactobacillus suebicus]|uniref:Phage integrase n=1 Tax=Paucilactobacillus suebicus DSM 5007 = KCTC 3549 TaxID=1423807 RepID=A0A0R1VWU6_9LACO|nr:site-specific integrase [Paucilactobacillus suebicus]KRM10174.1 phage integrase [Paucilactobacillus suebicus DSM 5007 = KCTC 3549]
MASIKKRGTVWQVRVSYNDQAGKRHTLNKSGFRTKREAELFATETQSVINKDELTDGSILFAKYFWEWFTAYKESSVRDRTRATYVQAYNVLEKYIPTLKIEDMDRYTYQKFIKEYGKTHAKSTVSKMNSLYHASVKDGIYDGFIKKDFVAGTNMVFNRANTRKVDYLNIDELTKLSNYLFKTRNHNFTSKYMILTALLTGMRPGEIGGLKWKDINFNFKTITISQSWNEQTKDFEPLKNESSHRTIRVDEWLLELLSELKNNHKLVFVNQYGTIPTSAAVNKVLRQSLNVLGIKRRGFHFHSCRHSHVAYLLSKGIDLYAISKRLGHSDIGITSKIYSYMIDEYKAVTDEKIVTALDSLIPKDDSYVKDKI